MSNLDQFLNFFALLGSHRHFMEENNYAFICFKYFKYSVNT